MENHLSDGELTDDSQENDRYSIISSEEDKYFKNLTEELSKRKLELELENELQRYDDYAKENRFENYRSSTSSNRKKQLPAKSKRTEIRNRSFRASSVLSNYSLPKRRKNKIQRKKRHSRHRSAEKSGDDDDDITLIDLIRRNRKPSDKSDSDDEDVELIKLRLNALKSKQELKEPDKPQEEEILEHVQVPEEELLRIDALKSALLRKKDHFAAKRKRKLENERPYSPTDHLDQILEDDPMELSNSPIESPFIEPDDINHMDMEISNSSPEYDSQQVDNLSDMEIASSPAAEKSEQIENDETMEDEIALRSMLLSSISTRRKAEEKHLAKNLKLAVERLRQAQHKTEPEPPPVMIQPPTKSGTKTIKMILEEKKNKKKPQEVEELLLNKITNEQNEVIEKLPTPVVQEVIVPENYSSISDTKNIPLLPIEASNKRSRAITSLDSIKRKVEPLIITVTTESSDDDQNRISQSGRMVKKTHRKIIRSNNSLPKNANSHKIDIIEKQVESILRSIRLQSEKDASEISTNKTLVDVASQPKVKSPVKIESKTLTAVNHLPKSAQIEYAMLREKMKRLEEAKLMRQKSRQLKRQKSSSISKSEKDAVIKLPSEELKKKVPQTSQKIEDTLAKIQQLDETARTRFASNAENKYFEHSKSLKDSTDEVIKLIDATSLDIRRREKVDDKIEELEKSLAKFRSMKKVVEQRINVGIPAIVRSQNALVKLRNHQFNFGNLCSRVGEIVRGPSYSLPDGLTQEIQLNLSSIVEKCDKIQDAYSDHFAIKHLKNNSQKIKAFVSSTAVEAKENDNDAITDCPIVPESTKRVLVEGGGPIKKFTYESPLEFRKSENGDNSEDNLNKVVCPLALKSSCTDANCKMLHI